MKAKTVRGPRAHEERVTGCTGQVQRSGQRAHCFEMGPSTLPPLERAHGMDGKTRDRRELLLRETRSVAERFELRAK